MNSTSTSSSADEAIRVLENDPSIRVIITDISMPGTMDGIALAHCVRERCPQRSSLFPRLIFPNDYWTRPTAACSFPKPYTRTILHKLLGQVDLAFGE
jgi:two-component system, response regulator PdtaR